MCEGFRVWYMYGGFRVWYMYGGFRVDEGFRGQWISGLMHV
jgi:hypothetical protein